MKVRILINDSMVEPRFRVGEIGDAEHSDFDKYDYYVTLPGTVSFEFRGDVLSGPRAYYFHASEVEIMKGEL